jgi:hypothetical protein
MSRGRGGGSGNAGRRRLLLAPVVGEEEHDDGRGQTERDATGDDGGKQSRPGSGGFFPVGPWRRRESARWPPWLPRRPGGSGRGTRSRRRGRWERRHGWFARWRGWGDRRNRWFGRSRGWWDRRHGWFGRWRGWGDRGNRRLRGGRPGGGPDRGDDVVTRLDGDVVVCLRRAPLEFPEPLVVSGGGDVVVVGHGRDPLDLGGICVDR